MVHMGSTCLEMWPFRKIIVLVAVVVRHPAITLYPSFDCNYAYCVIACSVIETNYHRVSNGYTIHSESSNLQTKQLKHKLPCYEYKTYYNRDVLSSSFKDLIQLTALGPLTIHFLFSGNEQMRKWTKIWHPHYSIVVQVATALPVAGSTVTFWIPWAPRLFHSCWKHG